MPGTLLEKGRALGQRCVLGTADLETGRGGRALDHSGREHGRRRQRDRDRSPRDSISNQEEIESPEYERTEHMECCEMIKRAEG